MFKCVHVPIQCMHCGYDLRGLSPAGSCPECGTAVWLSDAAPLGDQGVRWISRAQLATRILLTFAVLLMVAQCWTAARVFNAAFLNSLDGVVQMLLFGWPLLLVIASYILPPPEPPAQGFTSSRVINHVIVGCAWATLVGEAVLLAGPIGSTGELWQWAGLVASLAIIPAALALAVWYWRIAQYLGQFRLAEVVRWLMWTVFAIVSIGVVVMVALPLVLEGTQRALADGYAAARGVIAVASCGATLWAVALLWRFDRAFARLLGES